MKNFHGPYFAHSGEELWHWKKECPHFPTENYVSFISSVRPDENKLRTICMNIDNKEKKVDSEEST
jgi:hypothetical protein